MNNKNYEVLLKNLLSENRILFKISKSSREFKINFNEKEYFVSVPTSITCENEKITTKTGMEQLIKLNEIFNFNNFKKLKQRIIFFENASKYVTINDVQINLLIPNRQKAIWFESCYSELNGAILDFTYRKSRFILALEETNYDIKLNNQKGKKVKDFSTTYFDEDRLIRNEIFTDKDIEILKDIKVIVYQNNRVVDKISTKNVLPFLGKAINYENL